VKLHKSQRSQQAERICRRLAKRKGEHRLPMPKVYVIRRSRGGSHVWGVCSTSLGCITLHLGPKANCRREQYILLVHEFAHWYDDKTSSYRWRCTNLPHGERFQRLLWGMLPRILWARASRGQWIGNRSAHRPEFQP
jgi:hypothetical protein